MSLTATVTITITARDLDTEAFIQLVDRTQMLAGELEDIPGVVVTGTFDDLAVTGTVRRSPDLTDPDVHQGTWPAG